MMRWLIPGVILFALMAPLHAKKEEVKARKVAVQEKLTPLIHGKALKPLPEGVATYHFGWSGLTAAKGRLAFSHPDLRHWRLDAAVETSGGARVLWRMDATMFSILEAKSGLPLRTRQIERYRKKTTLVATEVSADEALRTKGDVKRVPKDFGENRRLSRKELKDQTGKKASRTRFPQMLDLHSALLQVRSQPLADGDVYQFVIFQDSPYLATIRVARREKLGVGAGKYDAIRLDLALVWLDKQWEARPHERFKRASGWLSDDELRLPLKLEAEVFIGSVWAELDSWKPKK